MSNIANRIKEIRIDHDTTQLEIANHLNIHQTQYHRYESGKRSIPIELLKKFCEYFQISADYILGLEPGLSWPRTPQKGGNPKNRPDSTK